MAVVCWEERKARKADEKKLSQGATTSQIAVFLLVVQNFLYWKQIETFSSAAAEVCLQTDDFPFINYEVCVLALVAGRRKRRKRARK